jgi:hypothetical protein
VRSIRRLRADFDKFGSLRLMARSNRDEEFPTRNIFRGTKFNRTPMATTHRFPPPWTIEKLDACFVVRDRAAFSWDLSIHCWITTPRFVCSGVSKRSDATGKRKLAVAFVALLVPRLPSLSPRIVCSCRCVTRKRSHSRNGFTEAHRLAATWALRTFSAIAVHACPFKGCKKNGIDLDQWNPSETSRYRSSVPLALTRSAQRHLSCRARWTQRHFLWRRTR